MYVVALLRGQRSARTPVEQALVGDAHILSEVI